MEEIKKKLNAVLIELQDAAGKVEQEIENFESDDEEATSPWEDTKSYLDEALENVENALNAFPSDE
jgi:hypothetical protein